MYIYITYICKLPCTGIQDGHAQQKTIRKSMKNVKIKGSDKDGVFLYFSLLIEWLKAIQLVSLVYTKVPEYTQ